MPENHPLFSFVCEGRKSVLYFFAPFFWKVPVLRVVWSFPKVLIAEKNKNSKHRKCSHTSENAPSRPCGPSVLLVGEIPKPLCRKGA